MTLARDVRAFMHAIDQPVRTIPTVPPDAEVRLRARLITEEAFELLEALFPDSEIALRYLRDEVFDVLANDPPAPRLPSLADACADLDYVVEGTRASFGIDGAPIAAAVHAANMTKATGPVDAHGKRGKPPGFQPPDVAGELRAQGWAP